jgi:hypothetical protein
MKTKFRAFALLIAVLALSSLAFGQATMQSTTLSAAIDSDQKTLVVASATYVLAPALANAQGGIGAPSTNNYYQLFIDRELMRVTAVSGTTVTVQRGVGGTKQTKHVSGAKVWTGPANYFGPQDAAAGIVEPVAGTPCTSALLKVLPYIAVSTGRAWACGNSLWTAFDAGVPPTQGATLDTSTSGTTITPTNPIHVVSGSSSSFATITVPAAMPAGGCIKLIPSGTWLTTTGGNIAVATQAVVSKVVTMCLIGTTWYPSL